MEVRRNICKKCGKQLLDNEKKYCRHCTDKRKDKIKRALTEISSVGSLALAVLVPLLKIKPKE